MADIMEYVSVYHIMITHILVVIVFSVCIIHMDAHEQLRVGSHQLHGNVPPGGLCLFLLAGLVLLPTVV